VTRARCRCGGYCGCLADPLRARVQFGFVEILFVALAPTSMVVRQVWLELQAIAEEVLIVAAVTRRVDQRAQNCLHGHGRNLRDRRLQLG